MNIAELSINRPVFIVMIIVSIITLGLIGYTGIAVDLLPNVQQPTLFVFTQYPGASAEEMETVITKPLENALGTVEGLDTLSSTSREGIAFIRVVFVIGTDIEFAELKVREKIDSVIPQLPTDITAPTIRRFSTDDTPIMFLSIRGPRTLPDLGDMVTNDVAPRLQALPGLGSVDVLGAQTHIIDISLDPSLLAATGITYQQIINAINAKNVTVPVGTIMGKNKNIDIRVFGQAQSVQDIADIRFTSNTGRILRVKDVAKVSFGLSDEQVRTRVNGVNAVLFQIYKQSGSNTVAVAADVRNSLPEITAALPGGISLQIVYDSSDYINRSIRGVQQDILTGALLAILIVWLFLGNFRSTIITALVLPNCLLGAFFLASIAGFSLNTMTLLALSLSVGLLIDDSIVVRENIFRYLEQGNDPKTAARKGTMEVALAVLSTTSAILAVFIPISFMQGTIGQFFKEFGLMVVFALSISLLDAFTTAPMLSAYWYKKIGKKKKRGPLRFFSVLSEQWNVFYKKLNAFYKKLLAWGLDHKKTVLITVVALFVGTVYLSRFIGNNFISGGDAGGFSIDFQVAPGLPLDVVDRYISDVEKFLAGKPYIDTYFSIIGFGGSNSGDLRVTMKALSERSVSTDQAMAQIRAYIHGKFEKDLTYRINPNSSLPGLPGTGGFGGGALALNVFGQDLQKLQELCNQLITVMNQTAGISDANTSLQTGPPELVITLDDIKAQSLGITTSDLASMLRDLIQGRTLSTTYTVNDRTYDIVVRLNEGMRNDISDFPNLLITTPAGTKVPLAAFCTFSYHAAPREIQHESRNRVARVAGNLEPSYSLVEVITRLRNNITRDIVFPEGYSYQFTGQQQLLSDLLGQILIAVFLAILFMYMILASLYNSFLQPFYIMLSILLAVIGIYLALLFVGIDLDVYGYIGLLLVLGLVAKNAILLVDFTNRNRKQGASIREALLIAGPIRLRPILMTSFAIIFGMLPLALGLNEGSSGRQAMPVAVIGGILTSTFLTLVVVPIVYEWVETRLERRRKRKKAAD
jgi:HAE1 family hydrophobic/amphiphilic exporter-1